MAGLCAKTFQILLPYWKNFGLKYGYNLQRTLCIPPLNSSSREAEDKLYLNQKESQKIYEIRTYKVRPKYYRDYIKFTEENFYLRIKHSKLFGFWSSELGALNEVIHVWEYDNHEHRAKVRKALANDKEWQTNYISQVAPMYISQTNATMMLLPWSLITLPSKNGLYELQIFHMNSHTDIWDGRLKAAMELSSLKLKNANSVLVGCFTSIFGPHNTVYALWQHESFDKFAFGGLEILNEPNRSILHAFYHEVLTGYSKGLIPHKASPLQ
ncbi:protein NipSnap homolog 3A [Parasteatoda tepidariorum]|uniref:protein NipSnap homolog 3A n=1 Tax=Parasteatoda tepidariorum TaxID=114398 RepID=UPI00077FDC93|nr:protein NipSnap homolog 3A [Parasteatoda tepidariorum]